MARTIPTRRVLLLLSAVLLSGTAGAQAPAMSPGTAATQALLEKAHSLEARGRMDMAAQTWQQVLLADPNNTEALGGLARAAKVAGNPALANTYLQRLRSISPNDPGIARAENAMTESTQLSQLQQAGKYAAAGNYAQAMSIYRRVFGSTPPQGDWALAYYETEAATEDGRAHAIAGLRTLTEKYPNDARYRVALGRILTYNPRTRAEGRRLLERYPGDAQAAEALKQAQVWDARLPAGDQGRRSDTELQEASRREGTQRPVPRSSASHTSTPGSPVLTGRTYAGDEAAGYAALNAKRYAEAEKRFRALLVKNPENPRALAGMGYVRMSQQNFGGAISFLEQAKQDGANDRTLDANLATSRYFYLIQEGGSALDENDLPAAEQQYRQALGMRPNGAEALQGLGGTLLKAQQPEQAEPYFQAFLRERPASAEGWRGLFIAQYDSGNTAGALQTETRIPAAARTQLMRAPDFLRTLASAYFAAGREADAQRVLQAALDLPFPTGAAGLKAETELQYAGLLLQANRLEQAAGLYRQVLAQDPSNALAWQGLVNAQHSLHNDAVALQTLESMPPGVYDQALREPGFLGTAAAIYQAQGKLDIAQSLLERAIAQQNTAGQRIQVPLQVQLAGLYLQRDDAAHAFPIYQRVLSENPDRVDAWKGFLAALHATNRDRDALAQVQQIPPAVRRQLESDMEYLQTVGNIYNGLGQPQQAMLYLSRVQQRYAAQHTQAPPDVDIQNAWLLFNGNNDTGLYRQLLVLGGREDLSDEQRRTVQTIWANWAVRRANQAAAAGNQRRALDILNATARAFPDNPGVVRALANGYLRAGQPKQAVAIYKSQDMTVASASDYKGAVGASLAANDLKYAEAMLRYALNQYPHDAQVLSLAARFEQARGDSNRAAEYYRASLAALPPPDPGSELAYTLSQPTPLNPRPLPTQQQDLTTLLAPGNDGQSAAYGPYTPLDTQARPYLPSAANTYGQSPVQLGANPVSGAPASTYDPSSGLPAGTAVPSYMGNPDASRNTRGNTQRLRDYVPPEPQSSPASGYTILPGISGNTYAPPQVSAPALRSQPARNAHLSMERDLPPVVATEPEATPYLPYQQQQVQRQTQQAQLAGLRRAEPVAHPQKEGAQTGDFNGEVYGPYVPYVPPTKDSATPLVAYAPAAVRVPPVQNVRRPRVAPRSGSAHPEIAAAEAAEARRRQSDPRSMTGESRPPADDLSAEVAQNTQYQVAQASSLPATSPTGQTYGTPNLANQGNGDSNGQQYPQPARIPPLTRAPVRRITRTRSATQVSGFGVAGPPVFYPATPAGLTTQPYPDLPPYNNAGGPPSDAQLIARNVPPLTGHYSVAADPGPPLTERQQTELDLQALEASYSAWMGGSGSVRFRSGRSGVERLFDYEIPFEATVVAANRVRFSVVPKAVFLNSGTLDLTGASATTATPILGTVPITTPTSPTPQFASGLGGELQITTNNLGLAVGYTPYEFLVSNVTGRFRYRAFNHLTFFAERDSVKDTQLSYAGLRDPGSVSPTYAGNIWGGVVSTGGGVRLDYGDERSGFYLSADGANLTGYHVLDNHKYEGTMGAYFRVKQIPEVGTLNIGGTLFGMHYDHNELPLTYGNGGYFSPEVYFLGAVPVTLTGHYGTDWHYIVSAAVGVQTFEQDTSNFYPLDPALQSGAFSVCTPVQIAQGNCPTAQLVRSTSTAANFNIGAQFSYRIADHWYVGGSLTANNTNNYTMVQPTFFARYLFRPQVPMDDYPTGLFPIDGFRPLRVQ